MLRARSRRQKVADLSCECQKPTRQSYRTGGCRQKISLSGFWLISKAKRPVQLIEGLRDFLKTLPEAEQQLVRLKFVGEVADQRYDPHHLAALMGVSSHVACTGYLPIEEFRNQLMDCHVFLNLRFPSCGETSGTLNELSGFDRPYAVSYYQAFAEEGATRHISIDPGTETAEITRFLQDAYRWTKFKDAIPAPQIHFENLRI